MSLKRNHIRESRESRLPTEHRLPRVRTDECDNDTATLPRLRRYMRM